MYKKTKEKKMHTGFPSVYNWIETMLLKDKTALQELKKAQLDMQKVLKGLTQ